MDYKKLIGEKVISYDGMHGVITDVDPSGYVRIKFEKSTPYDGGYMYDPFMAEDVKFVDPTKQKEIYDAIEKIDNDEKKIIDTYKAKSPDEETFFVTVANDENPHHENGLSDKAIGLSCSKDDAYKVFHYYIKQQKRNMRKVGNWNGFHQLGLYDAKTGKKICQET